MLKKSFRDIIKLAIALVMIVHLGILLFNVHTTWYMLVVFVLLYSLGIFWNIYSFVYPKKRLGGRRFKNSLRSLFLIYVALITADFMNRYYDTFDREFIRNSFILAIVLVILLFILEFKVAWKEIASTTVDSLEKIHNIELSENLKLAFNVTKLKSSDDGKNRRNYKNSALATLGDSLIKFNLAEILFRENDKGKITLIKSHLENNKNFVKIISDNKLFELLYNDSGVTYFNQTRENKLNQDYATLFEAIIAAIYLDFGRYNACLCLLNALELSE
ncbi:MAG: ribonuclease III domain-containing protein [Erysipelotrichales bacterium]|nr:ribonuclease III domain-containing protein [Erysipelotrichales bacterium]